MESEALIQDYTQLEARLVAGLLVQQLLDLVVTSVHFLSPVFLVCWDRFWFCYAAAPPLLLSNCEEILYTKIDGISGITQEAKIRLKSKVTSISRSSAKHK